jgi:hypothetical protein
MDINSLISRDEISKDAERRAAGGEMSDSRFLRIADGKTTVRLLPRLESKIPYKTVFSHRYNKNGEKLFATCRKTLGKTDCPICKKSWAMWNSENKITKDDGYLVRATPRYMFNCYVVNDPSKADNIGTVKILSVGKKLFDLILECFNSEDLGNSIFDPTNGFDFEINRKKSGDNPDYPDYSSSRFILKKGPIMKNLNWKEFEAKLINIDELVKEESVEELKEKFKFLGFDANESAPKTKTEPKKEEKKKEQTPEEDINIDELEGDNGEEVTNEKGSDALDSIDIDDELEGLQ